jgi:hypothetical protein
MMASIGLKLFRKRCNRPLALLMPAFLLGAAALVGQDAQPESKAPSEPAKAKNVFAGRTPGPVREALLKEGGGNERSEAAVAAGLKWLARHQAMDGHWGMHDFHIHGRCNCAGPGGNHDVAGTVFGLLPFLGAGETHKSTGKNGLYAKNVERGLRWLLARQGADGAFSGNGYEQGMATIAICEAYGMTGDPALKGPAQRAINCCVAWQHQAGGFRYSPRTPGDTSVTGWFAQALKTGQMAGLNVPEAAFKGLGTFLDACSNQDGSGYSYVPLAPATVPPPTVTAIGLLSRQFQGWDAKNPALVKGLNTLNKLPPSDNFKNIYYYFYATQVVHRLSPEHKDATERWKEQMRDLLIDKQDQGTNADRRDQKGSWTSEGDSFGGQFGRLGYTSLALLTLEVYYRHAPGDVKVAAEQQPEAKPEPKPEPKPMANAGMAVLLKELANRDSDARLAAVQKLAKLGSAAKEAVPNLTATLKDSNVEVRTAAQQALEAIHAEEVAALVKQLGDKEQKQRPQAARRLGELGAVARSAIPALEEAMKDPDPLVQFLARSALGKVTAAVKALK